MSVNSNKNNNKKTVSKPSFPSTKEIPLYKYVEETFKGRSVTILEVIKGYSVILTFDKEEKKFFVSYEKDSPKSPQVEATLDVNANEEEYEFHKKLNKAIERIGYGMISFSIYGEFVDKNTQYLNYVNDNKADFIIYDVYLNSNWMCQDDIQEIFGDIAGLHIAPKIYKGKFDEIEINKSFNKKSLYNKDIDVYGIIVKPNIEDEYKTKRIASFFIDNRYKEVKKDDNYKDTIIKIAYELAEENQKQLKYIKMEVERKFELVKKNKGEILSYSVNQLIDIYLSAKIYQKIYSNFNKNKASNLKSIEKDVIKELKKILPSYFMKLYKL